MRLPRPSEVRRVLADRPPPAAQPSASRPGLPASSRAGEQMLGSAANFEWRRDVVRRRVSLRLPEPFLLPLQLVWMRSATSSLPLRLASLPLPFVLPRTQPHHGYLTDPGSTRRAAARPRAKTRSTQTARPVPGAASPTAPRV